MNNMRILIAIVLLAFCIAIVPARAERVYLDITAQDVRKVVVAVPWFSSPSAPAGDEKEGKPMADLLSQGLAFHGFIQVVDSQKYGGRNDADWKALGVDYVVMSKFETAGSGMTIEGRLLDVREDKMMAGRRYRGESKQSEDMVLRLCDSMIEEFTGTPGISRSRVAYVSDGTGRKEVYVADALGRGHRQVTKHQHLVVSPRFSPDGNYLAYSSYHTGNQNLYLTDLRQSKVTNAVSRRKGMNLAPAWSPDGKTMIVTLSKDGSPDLYLIDREGQVKERLTSGAAINVSASWSPDGNSIVFVSDRSGTPQVYLMDLKSRNAQRLTFEGKENSEPTWSPKGDLIAFSSLRNGQYHIYTMNPANPKSVQQVSSGWGDCEAPTWSPDGKQIAFSRRGQGKKQIWVMLKDGREMRLLYNVKGNQSYPQWTKAVD
ncbi:MAG TPA: Tol-Pal system beta propeller repeat protein TolB [Desulfobulbaceae bacterium]|nr:Tol-Pal system beta propeller repeat protein TolB [Desulfobulbaceae bacterium]